MKSTELASMLRPFWQRDVSQIALYTVREASAELAAHSALPDIHHAQTHVLANTTGLGSDHTVAGLTAGQYLRASGATAAAFASIQDGDLPSTIVRTSRTLTAGDGLSGLGDLSADRIINIELSATSGLELVGTSPAKTLQIADTVAGNGLTIASKVLAVGVATTIQAGAGAGLSVEANAVRLTAGYDPGAASSILASDAAGKLTLPLMVATTSLTTPLILAGAGQSLTLQPPIDLILDPASNRTKMAAGVSIEASSYASQTTGWRVTDAGEADFRYLYVDEMHAKSFIADLEQALAGGQIIAKSVAVLHSNFTAPAAGATAQLVVRDLPSATGMAVFVNGDYIRIRTFSRSGGSLTIGDCWGTVALDTSYGTSGFDSTTKTQRYTFTRSSAADAGAMATGTVVYADAIILDYGTAGNGIYEVNAIDGLYALNSPYAQIATWTTHPRNMAVKSRLGNLRGIFSVDNEYGLYAGSGTAVTDRYIRASNTALELRNVPLALYDGTNNTMLLSAGASNNSPFMALGSTLPTEPLVNDGIWLGKDDTAYKFRVGAVSGGALVKGIYWDGADLIWKATNTSLDASGNLVAGPVTLSSAGVTSAATNDYANNAAYKFTSGGVVTSGTFAYATPTDTAISLSTNLWGGSSLIQDANRNAYTSVGAYAISTKDATTTFEAEARDAYGATVKLARIIANANGAQSSLAISADTVQLSGSITGHLLTTTAGTYDIGTSGTPWRKIYVGEVVATTITGSTALAGNTWQRADAGDMYIKSYTDATSRTLYISNPGTGSMHLDVEGNITLTGTVDGVDISAHAADTNAHHARSHAITSTSDHTATGLTTGHVLRASGAATFAWAQLAHGDLGSIGANDHHAQSHVLATNVALGADHTISGATPGHVLRASGATTALFAAIADADLPSTIVRTSRNMTAGAGLTGTSTLASDVTFAVGAGLGITVNADDVALTTPGSLTATSTNSSTGNHTHSIDSTIARSAITLTAGAGLTGGGDLTADRTIDIGNGDGITVGADAISLALSTTSGLELSGTSPIKTLQIADTIAGNGLTITSKVLAVGAGTLIAIAADTVGIATGATCQFIGTGLGTTAGWRNVSELAGSGLTSANGILDIGAGTGISVATDTVSVNTGAAFTWTGAHLFQSTITARHITPEATDTYDLGSATYWWRQQFVSQINAAVFAEQTIQLLGGWFMIPKDAGVLPAIASGTTQINFGKAMTVGNWIVVKAHDAAGAIKTEYMTIGALVSGTTYNVARDVAGAHTTDPTWANGTPYALLGGNGDGRIELNAYDTPRISLITQGATYNAQAEYIRLGDLNGMPGVSTQTWGIYIGEASQYLKYANGILAIAGNGSGLTSISGGNIQTGTITATQIAASTITATQIAADTITAANIAAGAITTSELAAGAVTAAKITAGTITATEIAASTITGAKIAATTITASNIAAGTITATQIAAGAITADKLTVVAGGENRLKNSGFEYGSMDGWGIYDNASQRTAAGISTTSPASGTYCYYISWSDSNHVKGVFSTASIHVEAYQPYQTYVVSWYAKTTSMPSGAGGMQINWNTLPATQVALLNPNLSTSWQQYAFRITWGASVDVNTFITISNYAQGANTLWIDNVKIARGEIAGGYAPAPEDIVPGTITADRLSVTSLSAISANMGALTVDSTLTMGASGTITATNTVMDADGVKIGVSSAFANNRSLSFYNGATLNSGLWAYADANYVQTAITNNQVATLATPTPITADRHSTIGLYTVSSGARTASVTLVAESINPTVHERSIIEITSANGTNAGRQIYLYTYNLNIETTLATINSNAIWHAGNDGAGSGLDADLLDGYSEAAFGRLAVANSWSAIQTLGAGLRIGGDPGGASSTIALSNVTATAAGATAYSLRMNGATAYENTGWMKIYVGTSVRYVPYWTTI